MSYFNYDSPKQEVDSIYVTPSATLNVLLSIQKILEAPCIFCGYNGENYWQRHSHSEDCIFYGVGGIDDRIEYIVDLLKRIHLLFKLNSILEKRADLLYDVSDMVDGNEILSAQLDKLACGYEQAAEELKGILIGNPNIISKIENVK